MEKIVIWPQKGFVHKRSRTGPFLLQPEEKQVKQGCEEEIALARWRAGLQTHGQKTASCWTFFLWFLLFVLWEIPPSLFFFSLVIP